MRAVLHGGGSKASLGWMKIDTVPLPTSPTGTDVMIKIAATAINRADLMQRRGQYPAPPGASPILGVEAAGTVHAVGSEVTKFKVGDVVMALLTGGAYAEFAVCPEGQLMRIPPSLTPTQAAAIPEAYLTAFQCLFLENPSGGLQPGQRVLIHGGASGIGTAAILLCKAAEAIPYVTCSAAKVPFCTSLGAIALPREKCPGDDTIFRSKLQAVLPHGQSIDFVLDMVLGDYFRENIEVMGLDSSLFVIYFLAGPKVPEFNAIPLLQKRIRIQFTTLRSRSVEYKARLVEAFAKWAEGKYNLTEGLRPVVCKELPMEECEEAHRLIEANDTMGKVVLRW